MDLKSYGFTILGDVNKKYTYFVDISIAYNLIYYVLCVGLNS